MGSSHSNMVNNKKMTKDELRASVRKLFEKSQNETTMRTFTPMNSLTSTVNVETVANEMNQFQTGGSRIYSINPNNIPSRQRYDPQLMRKYEQTNVVGGATATKGDIEYVKNKIYGGNNAPTEPVVTEPVVTEPANAKQESIELTDTPTDNTAGFFSFLFGSTTNKKETEKTDKKDVEESKSEVFSPTNAQTLAEQETLKGGSGYGESVYSPTSNISEEMEGGEPIEGEGEDNVPEAPPNPSLVRQDAQEGGSIDQTLDGIQKLINKVGGSNEMNQELMDDTEEVMKGGMNNMDNDMDTGKVMDQDLQKYMEQLKNTEIVGGGRNESDYEKSDFSEQSGGENDSTSTDESHSTSSTKSDSTTEDVNSMNANSEDGYSTDDDVMKERMELSMKKRRNKENYLNTTKTVINGRNLYSSASSIASDMISSMKHNDRLN